MSDFTALTRGDWLALADRFYARLDERLVRLTPAQWRRTTPYLGWSAHDVFAHMTSAIPVNFRQMLDRAVAGNPVAPAEFDTFWRNRGAVASRRGAAPRELIAEFHGELRRILDIYRRMSDADWLKPAWFFVGRVNVRTLFLVQFADNVLHERDLGIAVGDWTGLDPEFARPLVDWFLRELRTALFRPDLARGLAAVGHYRLSGAAGGDWTETIRDGVCRVDRGAVGAPDFTVSADTETLVAAGQGRGAPWVGRAARWIEWIRGSRRAEDLVTAVTGATALFGAVLAGRIKVSGDRALARRTVRAFWHFWQRTPMTLVNIAKG